MPEQPLRNQVAVVAGATRGAGRGIAVRTDHTVESEVEQLFARVRAEAGRLDILVNDIWGGDALTEWGKPFWELSIASDLHAHHVTALAITPGFLRSEAVLDFFGVTEANWRDAIEEDPYFAESETPCLVGRAVAALAVDPNVGAKSGGLFSTWTLSKEYGLTDVDGRRPDWGHLLPAQGAGDLDGPSQSDFKETIQARVERDLAFREALFEEGVECLLAGDLETGKSMLRDYINATIGFRELGGLTDKSPKSLMRMLGPRGNPQARNLFEIIGCLQEREGLHLKVQAVR